MVSNYQRQHRPKHNSSWILIQCTRLLSKLKTKSLASLFLGSVVCYSTIWILISHSSHQHGSSSIISSSASEPFFHNLFWNSKDQSAACLLVMDDNHFLIEWIAYHYHTLNLRRLILLADPKSLTTPKPVLDRWDDLIDIQQWHDSDYATQEEVNKAHQGVLEYFGGGSGNDISPKLVRHRARQRLFYHKCLQSLKIEDQYSWVLLTDTDEFLTLNYPLIEQQNLTAMSVDQPGSTLKFLNQHSNTEYAYPVDKDQINENQPLHILQSSPCIQIPRIRYGAKESDKISELPPELASLPAFNASDFLSLRWKVHASSYDYKLNKISKTLIDLSRVKLEDIVPVDSIHMPIRSICSQRRLHIRKSQSFLTINHYLGSAEQYTYRQNDARSGNAQSNERSLYKWEQYQNIKNPEYDDSIVPWLAGFVQKHNKHPQSASILLQDVGKLSASKLSWYPYEGDPTQERCALLFFGLPRAYRNMVLPSIIRNILIPNARHNCDVYVHFYEQYLEPAGRKNRGGSVNPGEIFLLEHAVRAVYHTYGPSASSSSYSRNANREPIIAYTHDTEQQFWDRRRQQIHKYHTTMTSDGQHPAYYPWKAKTYTNSSLDNIVKQWHSIEYAFKLMQMAASKRGINYTRVAMFRNDAMYLTPIDIAIIDKDYVDISNKYVVVAPFARLPINDRMIYGPYQAVKIWATERFTRIDDRARLERDPGYEMHSERFLNGTVFPAIEELGYRTQMNRDICFVRTRADESAMITDCSTGGITRGWDDNAIDKKQLVESIVEKNCTYYKMGFKWTFVGCGDGIEYVSTR